MWRGCFSVCVTFIITAECMFAGFIHSGITWTPGISGPASIQPVVALALVAIIFAGSAGSFATEPWWCTYFHAPFSLANTSVERSATVIGGILGMVIVCSPSTKQTASVPDALQSILLVFI